MGHLLEVCEGSGVQAVIDANAVPVIPEALDYLAQGCVPGGTGRNLESYGHQLAPMDENTRNLLCDPQTSGGLLIAVQPEHAPELESLLVQANLSAHSIGELKAATGDYRVEVL